MKLTTLEEKIARLALDKGAKDGERASAANKLIMSLQHRGVTVEDLERETVHETVRVERVFVPATVPVWSAPNWQLKPTAKVFGVKTQNVGASIVGWMILAVIVLGIFSSILKALDQSPFQPASKTYVVHPTSDEILAKKKIAAEILEAAKEKPKATNNGERQ